VTSFNAQNGPWIKPGIEDRLIELHGESHSFREIAEMLSKEFGVELTKNAIAGRCHRLCLKLRVKPRAVGATLKAKRKSRERKEIVIMPIPPESEPEPVHLEGVDLLDLQFDDCRWPYGVFPNYRYCGQPQHHRSYCKTHFKLSYVLPRERWGG
jgi:hypothetical protein